MQINPNNDEWSETEPSYFSGIIFEGSMFPAGHDEKIWGTCNLHDIPNKAGSEKPSDGNEDDIALEGNYIWAETNVPKNHTAEQGVQGLIEKHRIGQSSKRALLAPSGSAAAVVTLPSHNVTVESQALLASETLQVTPSISAEAFYSANANKPRQVQQAAARLALYPSDIDVEYKIDSQSIDTEKNDNGQLQIGTQSKSSEPNDVEDWNVEDLLSLWKFKVITKKGYEPMLPHFPGQTIETLRQTWQTHRQRCEQLGTAWKAAGKPKGPIEEWLH